MAAPVAGSGLATGAPKAGFSYCDFLLPEPLASDSLSDGKSARSILIKGRACSSESRPYFVPPLPHGPQDNYLVACSTATQTHKLPEPWL